MWIESGGWAGAWTAAFLKACGRAECSDSWARSSYGPVLCPDDWNISR